MLKKVLAVGISLTMACGLVACGSGEGNTYSVKGGKVTLGKYKGVVVYHDDVAVSEDTYKQSVDYILQQSTTTKTVKKGKVKKTDTVVVDYTGKIEKDGKKVEFDGGSAKDTTIDLVNQKSSFIDGFTDAIVGHKVGDEFTEKLTFPKKYQGEATIGKKKVKLAGKDVWFTYKVKSIQESETPKLTDSFVKEKFGMYGVKTVKEFKTYAKNQIRIQNIMNKVWESKVVKDAKVVKFDKTEKESLANSYKKNFEQQLQQQYGQNMDLKAYLDATKMSEKDWNKQVNEQVETAMKTQLVVRAIAEAESLVNDDSYKKEAETLAKQSKTSVKELESQYGKDQVEYSIMYQKVQEFIAKNVEEKKGSEPTTTAAPATTAKKAETTKKADKKSK